MAHPENTSRLWFSLRSRRCARRRAPCWPLASGAQSVSRAVDAAGLERRVTAAAGLAARMHQAPGARGLRPSRSGECGRQQTGRDKSNRDAHRTSFAAIAVIRCKDAARAIVFPALPGKIALRRLPDSGLDHPGACAGTRSERRCSKNRTDVVSAPLQPVPIQARSRCRHLRSINKRRRKAFCE